MASTYNPFLDEDDEENDALRASKERFSSPVPVEDRDEVEPLPQTDLSYAEDFQDEYPIVSTDEEEDLAAFLAGLAPDHGPNEQDDDWGFVTSEPEPAPASPSPTVEDDWGFVDDYEESSPPPQSQQVPLEEDDWGFEEIPQEQPPIEPPSSWDAPAYDEEPDPAMEPEAAPVEEESGLAAYLNNLSPEEDEEEPTGWRGRIAKLKADIRSELRGGEEAPVREEEQQDSGPGLAGKIFAPYAMLANLILKLLLTILSPLKKIAPLARFIGPNIFLRVLSYALPLIIVALILNWQGSKPLASPKPLSFPDQGRATIDELVYDAEKELVAGEVTNEGDVIAEVTVSFYVESLQRSINPLSFFFAKPNPLCVSETVTIPIGATKQVIASCPIEGSYKKMTAELSWK